MRARLDDNAREALQFLLLGGGIILAGRGLHHLLDLACAPGPGASRWEVAAEAFRSGYLVPKGTLVTDAMAMAGRLGVGALLTVLGGCAMAGAGAGMARLAGRRAFGGALVGARWGMALTALWCLYATMALPPRTARVAAGGLLLTERPALLGAIPWPGASRTRTLTWAELGACRYRTMAADRLNGGRERSAVVCSAAGTEHMLAAIRPTGRRPAEARAAAACQDLAQALNTLGGH